MFEPRQHQLDVRFSKVLRMGPARVQGNVDVYNLFNASDVINLNTRYGATWLTPTGLERSRIMRRPVHRLNIPPRSVATAWVSAH